MRKKKNKEVNYELFTFAQNNQVSFEDIAEHERIPQARLAEILGAELSEEETKKYKAIIEVIVKDRIISNSPDPNTTNNRPGQMNAYRAHRKYNPEIIDYMVSHKVTLHQLGKHLGYVGLGTRLKTEKLNKEQAAHVLSGIDELAKSKVDTESRDIWGRPISRNADLRKRAARNGVTLGDIAKKLNMSSSEFNKFFREELSEEQKDLVKSAIEDAHEEKEQRARMILETLSQQREVSRNEQL